MSARGLVEGTTQALGGAGSLRTGEASPNLAELDGTGYHRGQAILPPSPGTEPARRDPDGDRFPLDT